MRQAILYTGTFDPYHLGHLLQLERVYRVHNFAKAIIAINQNNPKKPNALPWQERVTLAKLALSSKTFPFKVVIEPIKNVEPETLQAFIDEKLAGYRVMRVVGSDKIQELSNDKHSWSLLHMFHYLVMVRPIVNREEMQQSINTLPTEVAKNFSYEIIYEQTEPDIAGRDIRKNIHEAFEKGLITRTQYDYSLKQGLYQPSLSN